MVRLTYLFSRDIWQVSLRKGLFVLSLGTVTGCQSSQSPLELNLPPEASTLLPTSSQTKEIDPVSSTLEEVTLENGNTLYFQVVKFDSGIQFKTLSGMFVPGEWPMEIMVLNNLNAEGMVSGTGEIKLTPSDPNPWLDMEPNPNISIVSTSHFISPEEDFNLQFKPEYCKGSSLVAVARIRMPSMNFQEQMGIAGALQNVKGSLPYGQIVCLNKEKKV